jgi:ribosomal protein S18 acetylase RimI-like enzyme
MRFSLRLNHLEDLDEVIRISIIIFNPNSVKLEKYHNKEDWRQKILNNGLLIAALDNDKIIGFSICYPREGGLHIWNVGVLEEYRKLGVWKLMHNGILEFAKIKKFKKLTLNTYKNNFPGMYAFVTKNGYKEYKSEKDKYFFVKRI